MAALNHPQNTHVPLPSRREFLYSLGGISAALFSAGACGLIYQYVTRNVPLEQQEAVYQINLERLPTDFWPAFVLESKTWLSRVNGGLIVLNGVCTFDDIPYYDMNLVKLFPPDKCFICSVCGTRYELDGTYIHGPSKCGLDRYGLWVRTAEGRLIASEGQPIAIDDAAQIFIDTRVKIPGQPRL